MSKYDFGYEIAPKSTIEWAYEHIKPYTTVLELGPATGNLAFHLSTEKECVVDIVEIDEDAGKQAARYARNSCLGLIEGNLERDEWFNKIKASQYDYIVVLDVLEHIRNAEEVLLKLATLLKEDSYILLSIPNITHNSIVIDLLRDRFNYTNVGILDDTHLRFYSYDSIKRLLNKCGLITIQEQVKQEKVGHNEIEVDYGVLPRSIEAYLKTKETGTAYQYLFTIKKGTIQPDIKVEYDRTFDRMYEMVVFDAESNQVLTLQYINPKEVNEIKVDIPKETRRVRIDPLNVNCIISNVKINAVTKNEELQRIGIEEHTGIRNEEKIVFFDDDPQIYVELPTDTQYILFSCEYLFFDDESIAALGEFRDIFRQNHNDLSELRRLLTQRDNTLEGLWKKKAELEEQLSLRVVRLEGYRENIRLQETQIKECREFFDLQEQKFEKCQIQLRAQLEQLVECQKVVSKQEEKLNMYSLQLQQKDEQLQQKEDQLLECCNLIKEQNAQLVNMSNILKITNENLGESEKKRTQKEIELEDYKYTANER